MCRVLTLRFVVVLLLEGWVWVAVCGGGENCCGNVLWFEKKVVTLRRFSRMYV